VHSSKQRAGTATYLNVPVQARPRPILRCQHTDAGMHTSLPGIRGARLFRLDVAGKTMLQLHALK
jgi:hypothetical protein